MSALEAFGLVVVLFFALFGVASALYLAWHGVTRLRGHLDLGRLDEDRAIRETLGARIRLSPDEIDGLTER